MPRKKVLNATTTMAPSGAMAAYDSGHRKLTPDEWGLLSNDLLMSVNASLSEREALEQNLQDWSDLYEMRVDGSNWPWENASNVFIPVIPSQLDTAVAYIIGKVFVPRFYIVSGNTPEASKTSHDVERYYNAELVRQRGNTTWYEQYLRWLHLSFRDGTSYMEVLWKKVKTKRRVVTFEPDQSDDGVPVVDMSTGRPKMKRVITEVESLDYNDVQLTPISLKDFILIPQESPSINEAVGVGRVLWLYEDDLRRMVKESEDPDSMLTFSEAEVEFSLAYAEMGNSDVASDRQGSYDKTAGDQIQVGQAQGSQTSKFFKNRGPIKVWRIHTRQYDMNNDGVPEENIYWWDERTQRMLGWAPYEYIADGRPFFDFCPYPRPDSPLGFSLPERLAAIQAETNAMWNGRNNLFDLILAPPLLYSDMENVDNAEHTWAPAKKWRVTNIDTSVKFFTVPSVPMEHFQNEQLLQSYTEKLTGVSSPIMGAQSSGRRTATEMKQQSASTSTRNDLVALRLRIQCRAIFNFVHTLKLQYMDSDLDFTELEQKFTLPREVLAQDYGLDISGSADPIDTATRRQEDLALFQLLMQVPTVAQDPLKQYHLLAMMVESFNKPNTEALIGTEDEAQQAKMQQQQAMAEQQKAAQMGAMLGLGNHGKQQGPGGQGQPQQGPKPPGAK